jgi:hypothetical protein
MTAPLTEEIQSLAQAGSEVWQVNEVDADFDDETGRTGLRIDASIEAAAAGVVMFSLSFQATILAAL